MAPLQKHGLISRGLSAKRMRRRISNRVRLGFDDSPAHPAFGGIVDQRFSYQIAGKFDGIDR
jgi:hypothetical protein